MSEKQHVLFLTPAPPPVTEGYNYIRLKGDKTKPIYPARCVIAGGNVYILVDGRWISEGHYDFFGPLPELREASTCAMQSQS